MGGMEGQELWCPHTSELLAATLRTHGCIPRTAAAGARGPVAVKPQAMYCIVRVLGIATRGLEEGARLGTTLTECAGQGGSDRVVALATPATFLVAPPTEPPVPLGGCSSARKRSEQKSV
jgi:hypothetical protein